MSRRKVVALSSAAVILLLVVAVVATFYAVTGTNFGREWTRRQIMALTKGAHGRIYVGRLSGGFLTGVRIDSLEIRDEQNVVFLATGAVTAHYDPRDLLDRRILIAALEVEHPYVHLVRHADGKWNWRRIFPEGPKGQPKRPGERGFGDFIVARNVRIRGGRFTLTMPWAPADSLTGARRDSAVRVAIADTLHEFRRGAEGLERSWRWTEGDAEASYVRIADPDSTGRIYDITRLAANENDPPLPLRDVRAVVRTLGDSAWLDVAHFALPGSRGTAKGKVVWGGDHPIIYAVHVIGDTVSLSDVGWVYPTLPRTGGGRLLLDIRNEPKNLQVLNYALSRMDVRTTASRLTGAMTFGVGGPVLAVKDVNVDARPIDFALIRALNGKPFPYDWRGRIDGHVTARGGPLNRFVVDSSRFVFADANVPGAVTRGTGHGALDILLPAYTRFLGFEVNAEQVDLRTLEFLNPKFPRIGGTVSGHARLDSVWTDVRFADAELTHTDGPDAPSVLAGGGRLTIGDRYITYDLDMEARPLSLSTLARSYPLLPARGTYTGPLRVQGTLADLLVQTELTGPAGRLALDGRLAYDHPPYGWRGTATLAGFDASRLGTGPTLPATSLDGDFDADLRGSSLGTLAGQAQMELRRSSIGNERVRSAQARLRFADGRVYVDTLAVDASAATLGAHGALGLVAGVTDTLRLGVRADSLGGFRALLGATEADTLDGSLSADLTLAGTVDTLGALDVAGEATGTALRYDSFRTRTGQFTIALADVLRAPRGRVQVALDTLSLGTRALARAALSLDVASASRASYALDLTDRDCDQAAAAGRLERDGPGQLAVRLDTAAFGAAGWRLARGGWLRSDSLGLALDTLVLRGPGSAAVSLGGTLPKTGPVQMVLRADSLALGELGHFVQVGIPLDGVMSAEWTLTGSRAMPLMDARATLVNAKAGAVRLEAATATMRYADRRLDATVDLFRGGRAAFSLSGRLPLDLAIAPVEQRKLEGPLEARLRSDSVDLSALEAFVPGVERASGTFQADVDVGGGWRHPELAGAIRVVDGAFTMPSTGIRYQRVNADLALVRDSVAVRNVSAATTHEGRNGRAALSGAVTFRELTSPSFSLLLTANAFHAFEKPRVADLEVSTSLGGLRLTSDAATARGGPRGSELTGGIVVQNSDIYIPELAAKRVVSLDDPEFYRLVDTSLAINRTLLPNAPSALVQGLRVREAQLSMGNDVWLRSSEANINLSGGVAVTVGRTTGETPRLSLALQGRLGAERGTYRLNLGPVQRTFEVERGALSFFGEQDADLNPTLDISAVHTVRRPQRQDRDVQVRVHITGTLAQPRLELTSDDARLSESDLISYLVTGQPSTEIATNSSSVFSSISTTATSVLLPSFGSYLSDKLAGVGIFDLVTLQTAAQNETAAGGTLGRFSLGSSLQSTRANVCRQVGGRLFACVNAGLCSIARTADATNFDVLGARLEYQFGRNGLYSLSLAADPPTNGVVCQGSSASRGFVSTPRQYGLDFLRHWDF